MLTRSLPVPRVIGLLLLTVEIGCRRSQLPNEQRLDLGGRSVVVWAPPHADSGRSPVIIFSHGFTGCATQSRFLAGALAAAGYWVLAPEHRDARCGRGRFPRPELPLGRPDVWTDKTYVDRANDIRAVLAAITTTPPLADHADLSRIGLAGHSLGGYTVLGLAGGWPAWRMPQAKAVLALSPYVQPYLASHTLSAVAVPVMYQGGTIDVGITPWLRGPRGAYAMSPAPKYYMELAGAGHLAWTDLRSTFQPTIDAYAIAFFNHYLRDSTIPVIPSTRPADVAEWETDAH